MILSIVFQVLYHTEMRSGSLFASSTILQPVPTGAPPTRSDRISLRIATRVTVALMAQSPAPVSHAVSRSGKHVLNFLTSTLLKAAYLVLVHVHINK